jgi:RecG-like helicase
LPPKGYANLSIREDVRRMLDELRAETGIHDLSDLLVVLVRTYRDYTNAISKIKELLTSNTSKTLTNSTSKVAASTGNNPQVAQGKAKVGERKHVISFTLKWAEEKSINVEEYMARKEREGYICNETGREVVCIWREDVEQLVVELNSAGARMGELDKVLSGEKLETARVAERAGLLWYDSREKRWRAPL